MHSGLSGMPSEESLASYPRCDIQLCWLTESLTSRGGAVIPGALQMQVAITDARSRDQQWKEAWPVIRQTLMSGGSVLGHCVAGRHRAAGGQALILSLITDSTFQEAQATVGRLRECQIYKLMEQGSIAQWIRHVRKTAVTGIRRRAISLPKGLRFTWTLAEVSRICRRRQGSDAGQRLRDYTRVADLQEAEGYQRAFCRDCLQRASAVFHPK